MNNLYNSLINKKILYPFSPDNINKFITTIYGVNDENNLVNIDYIHNYINIDIHSNTYKIHNNTCLKHSYNIDSTKNIIKYNNIYIYNINNIINNVNFRNLLMNYNSLYIITNIIIMYGSCKYNDVIDKQIVHMNIYKYTLINRTFLTDIYITTDDDLDIKKSDMIEDNLIIDSLCG